MDTKKLRQKILDLAIHGKLVPQDPNDEPASVLLERIKAEKERLIKEGKIKRSKKTAKTSDTPHYENVPFEVPDGWVWCRLEDIAYVASGSTPDKTCFVENGIPYIKMYNLRNQKIDFAYHPQYITEEVHNGKLLRSRTEVGDLIMNIVGPPLGKLAIIPATLPQANFNQAAVLIRPYKFKKVLVPYLKAYLEEMSEINSIATRGSAGQVNISLTQSQNMRIPLPPLNEVERIINEVVKYDLFIEAIEYETTDLQALIISIKNKILDLAIHGKLIPQDPNDEPALDLLKRINPNFTPCDNAQYGKRPFEIPNSWCWSRLGDINNIARGGSPRPIKDYLTDDKNGINWIKIGDTTREGKYIDSVKEKIRPEGMKKSRFVHKGDFLLTNSMSFGRPYILNVDGCIHDGWLVISPIGEVYTSDFMYHLLSSSFAFEQFTNVASGGVVTNLNSDKVADTIFPVPPLAEQQRIVAKIEKLFEQLDYIENSLEA